jgi:hypothetical protein
LKNTFLKSCLLAILSLLVVGQIALAQEAHAMTPAQSVITALANLPDADMFVYVSPQKILNDAIPRFMEPAEITKMRAQFGDLKKAIGVDPSTIEYLVIAVRFHKPTGDLSFVAPDILAVAGGDFSADSLFTMAQLYAQDKARTEKRGSKTMLVMKIDPIAEQAAKTPLLKSLVELGLVPLSANSLAIGNLAYLQSAVDASEGTGRISPTMLQSLMRDPNVLMASTGAPLTSLAKAFGLYGTETTARDSRCETTFGNFYSAITLNGSNLSFRGAMNADNPDTAKIISSLLESMMQQGIDAVPDKDAKTLLHTIKLTPKDNEVVWESNVPESMIKEILAPKPPRAPVTVIQGTPQKKTTPRRPIRKKRPRQ